MVTYTISFLTNLDRLAKNANLTAVSSLGVVSALRATPVRVGDRLSHGDHVAVEAGGSTLALLTLTLTLALTLAP